VYGAVDVERREHRIEVLDEQSDGVGLDVVPPVRYWPRSS
jgi:hypothetical protein